MNYYLGAHMGSYNLVQSIDQIVYAGGNIIQIFMIIPEEYNEPSRPTRTIKDIDKFKKYLKKNNVKVVVHSSYTHNFCRDWDKYSWWIKNFELELKYAYYLGAIGIVLHFGKKLELSLEQAFNNMYSSLIYVHNNTLKYNIPILLETPTGQGTEICYRLEELSKFYKKFSNNINKKIKDRFKICIDTCHIFSAGYDIRTTDKVNEYLQKFDNLVGLRNVKLIHLNDCKLPLGSRKDRHQNIGKGYIGTKGLVAFFKYFRKLGVPVILETPGDGYIKEIQMLKNS